MSDYIVEMIKDNIDISFLIDELGGCVVSEKGHEIRFHCMNPNHRDRNPSCDYNVLKHQWNCQGCSWGGGLVGLVMRVRGVDYGAAVEYLQIIAGISPGDIDEDILVKTLRRKKVKKETEIEEIVLPLDFDLDFSKADDSILFFIEKRKITKETIEKYYIGYCNKGRYAGRIIIPIIHFDKIVGFASRATWEIGDGDPDLRYMYDSGSNVGKLIWGLYNNYDSQNPVFVEGILDALRLRSYGLNSYSCLNNNVTEHQATLIRSLFGDKIYVMPDSDSGGDKMVEKFTDLFIHSKDVRICKIMGNGRDPDDLPRDEAVEIIESAKSPYTLKRKNRKEIEVNKIVRSL